MKNVKPKKEKVVKPKVTLISYSMKMVIPTGNYANIQPEIIVKSGSIEEAHSYIAPHMNKLWKEYYLIGERRTETAQKVEPGVTTVEKVPTPPVSDVAFMKASQAITSCLSIEALDLIKNQVNVSVKLTPEDKIKLAPLIESKSIELNAKNIQE